MTLVTVSDKNKYVCVWGNPEYLDTEIISDYKNRGYAIVKLNNGTGNIRDCFSTIAKSISI